MCKGRWRELKVMDSTFCRGRARFKSRSRSGAREVGRNRRLGRCIDRKRRDIIMDILDNENPYNTSHKPLHPCELEELYHNLTCRSSPFMMKHIYSTYVMSHAMFQILRPGPSKYLTRPPPTELELGSTRAVRYTRAWECLVTI